LSCQEETSFVASCFSFSTSWGPKRDGWIVSRGG
jgi:hypothetical protein